MTEGVSNGLFIIIVVLRSYTCLTLSNEGAGTLIELQIIAWSLPDSGALTALSVPQSQPATLLVHVLANMH